MLPLYCKGAGCKEWLALKCERCTKCGKHFCSDRCFMGHLVQVVAGEGLTHWFDYGCKGSQKRIVLPDARQLDFFAQGS